MFLLLLAFVSLGTKQSIAEVTNFPNESLVGKRPNIILVMTDDQGMGDFSCLGNKLIKTPNLDQLYKQSTRFTDFHVSPTCAPTRSAIFSGRHDFRNGVTHTINERERMALSTVTFSTATTDGPVTKQESLESGIWAMKKLINRAAVVFLRFSFTELEELAKRNPGSCADYPPNRVAKGRYFDNVIRHNDRLVQTKGFCTDVFFNAAIGWTKKQHDAKKPFFTYITLNAPHGPMIAPDKYKERFQKLGWDNNTAGRYGMIENM